MNPRTTLWAWLLLLALIWLGPLPGAASHSFLAHMAMHVGVLALASPLLALGFVGWPAGGLRRRSLASPVLPSPVLASLFEFVVVWGWHAPGAHHFARQHWPGLVAEQASFLLAGLWLWRAALEPARAAAGPAVIGLLTTSMHMTLLGALLALAPRELYSHGHDAPGALADQQLGGLLMLAVAGSVYLIAGLWRLGGLLADRTGPLRAGAGDA